ncbi:MAG: helix-turn-helix domain-containing protein [Lewinella sp.]|nr:helix-turn-helix domain-containing protein [Lewinella sp.]
MAQVLSSAIRTQIVRMCQSGKSAAAVSRELNLGYPGVAKVWRAYRFQGEQALEVGFHRCGRKSAFDESIRHVIDAKLKTNDQLGAPIIRSQLLKEGDFAHVPHERTIQRWWKAAGKNKPRGRGATSSQPYARDPHETWQVDGKEDVRLADDSRTSYLSITDEDTCSFLRGHVFPLGLQDEPGEST